MPDVYQISIQVDIISAVARCPFISTFDCASFYFQWPVKNELQNCLIVAFHRDQEIFTYAVMGFRNLLAYVQRRIGSILRTQRSFARAYTDDIVIFTQTFEKKYNRSLKNSKNFVLYSALKNFS